jgi:hypothetical protein
MGQSFSLREEEGLKPTLRGASYGMQEKSERSWESCTSRELGRNLEFKSLPFLHTTPYFLPPVFKGCSIPRRSSPERSLLTPVPNMQSSELE